MSLKIKQPTKGGKSIKQAAAIRGRVLIEERRIRARDWKKLLRGGAPEPVGDIRS